MYLDPWNKIQLNHKAQTGWQSPSEGYKQESFLQASLWGILSWPGKTPQTMHASNFYLSSIYLIHTIYMWPATQLNRISIFSPAQSLTVCTLGYMSERLFSIHKLKDYMFSIIRLYKII